LNQFNNSNFFKQQLEHYNQSDSTDLHEEIESTILMLNIYYSSLTYRKISQSKAMTIDQMISSIGGNMGLFVGMSVLTMCDFLQLVSKIAYTLSMNKLKHKRQTKPE
jgi:hypothetical protein